MHKLSLLVLTLIIGCWPHSARADQSISLIQTLCIPEPGIDYFSARLESFAQAAGYIHFGTKAGDEHDRSTRIKLLERYGLIFPDEFSYTCKLEHHTYTITGHRPPHRERGMCGGNPRIQLSLKRDDETILDDVFFEPSCFSDTRSGYVESFAVEDDINDRHHEYVDITLSDGKARKVVTFHQGDHNSLNRDQLYCLTQMKFFEHGIVATTKELEPYEQCRARQHDKAGEHREDRSTNFFLLATAIVSAMPLRADETKSDQLACDSFHAVYSPSSVLPESVYPYQSRLTVERIKDLRDLHPGYPEATFALDTLSWDGKTLLSRLEMPYACDGEGAYCKAAFSRELKYPDGKEHNPSFPVIALNRDFSRNLRSVSSQYPGAKDKAPYALIFANLTDDVAMTYNWESKKRDFQFFTANKVAPWGYEVWVLTSCKK